MPCIGRFDRLDARLEQVVRDAAIALERKLDVGRGHRIAIVEAGAVAQHEVVASPVLGNGKELGKAGRQRLAGHRLHHRIVQGIEHQERRDDAGRLGRLEPGGRERDMDAPGQLAGRRRGRNAGPARRQTDGAGQQDLATADRRAAANRNRFAANKT